MCFGRLLMHKNIAYSVIVFFVITLSHVINGAELYGPPLPPPSPPAPVFYCPEPNWTWEEEILESDEYFPYYTLKYVLVEEGNELKVGYFVLLPPSMFD